MPASKSASTWFHFPDYAPSPASVKYAGRGNRPFSEVRLLHQKPEITAVLLSDPPCANGSDELGQLTPSDEVPVTSHRRAQRLASERWPRHPSIMTTQPVTVYFDGACHLCSREIEHYRDKDQSGKLCFVDISLPSFDAPTVGLDRQLVQKLMHVRLPDGTMVTGVDAFVAIWNVLPGYSGLSRVAKLPVVNLILRGGYRCFAAIRPLLPKRPSSECTDGSCAVRLSK